MGCASGKHQPSEPGAAAPPNTLLGSSGQAAGKPAHSASQATPASPTTTQSGVPPDAEAPTEQAKSVSAELAEGGQCAKENQARADAGDAAASAGRTAGDATMATSAAPVVDEGEDKNETTDTPRNDTEERSGVPTATEAPTEQVAPFTTEGGEEGRGAKTSEEPMEPTGMLGGAEHAKADAAKASDAALALREAEGAEVGLSEDAAVSQQPLETSSSERKASQEVLSGTLEHEVARAGQVEEQSAKTPDPEADVQQVPAAAIDDLPARAVGPSMGLWGACCRGPESTEPEMTVRSSQPEAESQ